MVSRHNTIAARALTVLVPLTLGAFEIDDYDKMTLESLFFIESVQENSFLTDTFKDELMENLQNNFQNNCQMLAKEAPEQLPESAETLPLSQAYRHAYIYYNYSDSDKCSELTNKLLPPVKKEFTCHLKKEFTCHFKGCNYSSDKKNNLTAHLYRHKRKSPLPCPICKRLYKSVDSLRVHRRTMHKHTRE